MECLPSRALLSVRIRRYKLKSHPEANIHEFIRWQMSDRIDLFVSDLYRKAYSYINLLLIFHHPNSIKSITTFFTSINDNRNGDDSGSPFSNNSDTIAENHDVKAGNISDIFLKYLIILSFGFVAVLLLVIGKKEMHCFQKHKAFVRSTC